MKTYSELLVDDLVRTIAIISASDNVRGPEFTAEGHAAAVELCRNVMSKHRLRDWCATTKDTDPQEPDGQASKK